jgi:hypothetical protein
LVFLARDGLLSRLEGFLLFAGFTGWRIAAVRETRWQRSPTSPDLACRPVGMFLVRCAADLVLLIDAGHCVAAGARRDRELPSRDFGKKVGFRACRTWPGVVA